MGTDVRSPVRLFVVETTTNVDYFFYNQLKDYLTMISRIAIVAALVASASAFAPVSRCVDFVAFDLGKNRRLLISISCFRVEVGF
jgi:hypothetical protein